MLLLFSLLTLLVAKVVLTMPMSPLPSLDVSDSAAETSVVGSSAGHSVEERSPGYFIYKWEMDENDKYHPYVCNYNGKQDRCRKCEWRSIPPRTEIEGYGTKGFEIRPCHPTPDEMDHGAEGKQHCPMPGNPINSETAKGPDERSLDPAVLEDAGSISSDDTAETLASSKDKKYKYLKDNKPRQGFFHLYACKQRQGRPEKCKRINWRHIPRHTFIEGYGWKTKATQPWAPPLWVEKGIVRHDDRDPDPGNLEEAMASIAAHTTDPEFVPQKRGEGCGAEKCKTYTYVHWGVDADKKHAALDQNVLYKCDFCGTSTGCALVQWDEIPMGVEVGGFGTKTSDQPPTGRPTDVY